MKIGTRSILFGVHQFLWHPITVLIAWRRLYHAWPQWWELIAIFCHDLGYWGLPNIDGKEGRRHPINGAKLARRVVECFPGRAWYDGDKAFVLSIGHSRAAAVLFGCSISRLCAADKACVLYDPKWFYLLRAKLSGEIREFKAHAIRDGYLPEGATDSEWFDFYRAQVRNLPIVKALL